MEDGCEATLHAGVDGALVELNSRLLAEPWVMGAEYSTGIGAFLGSWNGMLCLSAGYNEAFHLEAEVLEFLERVKGVVIEGLEVHDLADSTDLPLRVA